MQISSNTLIGVKRIYELAETVSRGSRASTVTKLSYGVQAVGLEMITKTERSKPMTGLRRTLFGHAAGGEAFDCATV